MNHADLPREVTHAGPLAADSLLSAVRLLARGDLSKQVTAIDQQGLYPKELLCRGYAVPAAS